MESGLKGRVAIVAATSQEEVADTIVCLASERFLHHWANDTGGWRRI
jgi:hypothetical protein